MKVWKMMVLFKGGDFEGSMFVFRGERGSKIFNSKPHQVRTPMTPVATGKTLSFLRGIPNIYPNLALTLILF